MMYNMTLWHIPFLMVYNLCPDSSILLYYLDWEQDSSLPFQQPDPLFQEEYLSVLTSAGFYFWVKHSGWSAVPLVFLWY